VVAAAGIPPRPGRTTRPRSSWTLVNLYGTWLAVEACLPPGAPPATAIVTFSGGGATAPLPRVHAYAASRPASCA
jgi:hypothetical protein